IQQIWKNDSSVLTNQTENKPLLFLQKYQCSLFPEQSLSQQSVENFIAPLKLRTTELILKQINIYYLPHRLESLLLYCDPFTAVGTFLN
ncbi:hypothetical protein SB781_35610, partial [Paraburkholderia sp. SIMBA_061]